jgi:hypothetical protein
MSKAEAEETDPSNESQADLGFTYLATKSGIVFIRHHGRLASELRSTDAAAFLKKIEGASFSEEQQLMARVTGNYKHGNERVAGKRGRNR